jgi:hypothetical protein
VRHVFAKYPALCCILGPSNESPHAYAIKKYDKSQQSSAEDSDDEDNWAAAVKFLAVVTPKVVFALIDSARHPKIGTPFAVVSHIEEAVNEWPNGDLAESLESLLDHDELQDLLKNDKGYQDLICGIFHMNEAGSK